MASESFHEQVEELSPETRELHRAIVSLMEELEAIDWYQQRTDAAKDEDLRAVLAHNRDEEIEHAMMVLEWIRRRHAKFDEATRIFLFSEGPITEVEAALKAKIASTASENNGVVEASPNPTAHQTPMQSLGIGSLKIT